MSKQRETLEEAVEKYLKYEPSNPCWHDFWYLEDICGKYGYDVVHKEVKRQEKLLT